MGALSEKDLKILTSMVPTGRYAVTRWELYTLPGVQEAADALSALVATACETALDTLRTEGMDAAQNAVQDLYNDFAKKYREYGATDAEPQYKFKAVVNLILSQLRQFKLFENDW